jgi:3-hydroxyisobutyryl-CoA hydrolase
MSTVTNTYRDPHEFFKAQPDDEPQDVVFHSLFGLRTIELNRPKKYNALNGSMIRKIGPRLIEWQKSDMANVIVMKGAGDAFCAGGDVMQLAKWNQEGPAGQQKSIDYFALEYRLDHMIATCGKPYIAFMDGITMGGGVGLSVHAPFRIATERTVFAMPETTIGFFPDVGASFFLPKLPGALGTYLALTSDRLKGVNAFFAGVATHYLHSTSLASLESRLAELRFKDYDDLPTRLSRINMTLEEFCTGLPHDQPRQLHGVIRQAIDRCFRHERIEHIIEDLGREGAEAEAAGTPEAQVVKKWVDETIDTLHKRSPTSVHVALRQMHVGKHWSIAETFMREHQIASKFMRHPDFVEGVTKQLSKPRTEPKWQPASLEDISPDSDITGPFFEMAPGTERLALLNRINYAEYPFSFGLPSEQDLQQLLEEPESSLVREGVKPEVSESEDPQPEQPEPGLTKAEVLEHFMKKTLGKQGVVEALEELIARKTVTKKSGELEWVEEEY